MLNYLIQTVNGLLITAAIAGLLYSCVNKKYARPGYMTLHIGAILGLLTAVVMSVLKNTTSKIATGMWNVRIFTVSLIAAVLFGVLSIPAVHKKSAKAKIDPALIAGAVFLFSLLFYALPDIYAYPFNFSLGGAGILSSAFFTRFAGWLFGIILCILTGTAVYKAGMRSDEKTLKCVLITVLLINGIQQISKILQVLYTRRYISGHAIFVWIRETSNRSNWFLFAIMLAIAVLPVVLWIKSFNVNEPYENPAQHRKIRAKWRSARRWSNTLICCFILGVLVMTAINAYANRPEELSPVEECELRNENLYIPITQVEDGHLHRFAYTTPDNITVRFIVIKKPNASSYGVGLDACDICGETGYYERNNQIVCKLCDVVMNVNTIGFKGGCNPIVIDYSVEGGYIIVPTYTLIDHQSEFK